MPDSLSVEVTDHIATVTLQAKTMAPVFFTECAKVFDRLSGADGVRAIVIQSANPHFTYGLDLKAAFSELGTLFAGGTAATRLALLDKIREMQGGFNAIAACPVPVIAAVHGWCIGGGLDLISACDIRLASRDAKISLRETRIAIVADMGSLQRLPPIIGEGHTRELAFTGKDITAERAERIGLVNHVYEDRDALHAAAHELAAEIAANAPLTVRGVKEVLNYGEAHSVDEGLEYIAVWNSAFLASEDLGEAATAFMTKRAPVFKGK